MKKLHHLFLCMLLNLSASAVANSEVANSAVENSAVAKIAAAQGAATKPLETTPLNEIETFARMMARQHQFDEKQVKQQLINTKLREDIIEKISKPAESMAWYNYRKIWMTEKRIQQGVDFWRQHQAIFAKAEKAYGVDQSIILAIIGVETFYGKVQGSYPVIEALYTLGFHYPKREKFFRQELAEYFLLAREQNWPLESIKGSYAGAMGMGQFISSSYRHYAVDFNQDGKINLFSDIEDIIGSVANYFHRHGWKKNGFVAKPVALSAKQKNLLQTDLKLTHTPAYFQQQGIDTSELAKNSDLAGIFAFAVEQDKDEYWLVGKNFYVITRYNRSQLYALAVLQLSQAIKQQMQKVG